MNTFHDRITEATLHENRVLQALKIRRWTAEPYGQGQLSPEMRNELRRVPTLLRWIPDIIAAKQSHDPPIAFIDAKAGRRYQETGNHDIEISALEAAEKWMDFAGDFCPYYFVFDDGGVTTPAEIREGCWDGPYRGNGSGTPFKLFPVAICQPFDAVFGQKPDC